MKIFAANWKLHKNPKETREFFQEFKALCSLRPQTKVLFFPQAICLEAALTAVSGTGISCGAQNIYFESKGAFTGENSAQNAKEMGAEWALIGHSERRSLFGEVDHGLAKKVAHAQSLGLSPMLCIGETLDQREKGETNSVLKLQLVQGLSLAEKSKPLAIAYEPVWAIGTGKVASIEQVRETHQAVRQMLTELGFSTSTPILYGGSVKKDNAKDLIQIPNVDGFLVGGASLEPKSFWDICSVDV
ncbi:MAG: triosephosphate isomerase [Oligoflexia bacterium]|nr:MAG: triosephosphate isomerase [Oligoflexia bacterium]